MTDRTVRLPDGTVVKDPQTGYHWLLMAEHPAGGAWVALRWLGPFRQWSLMASVLPQSRVDGCQEAAMPDKD